MTSPISSLEDHVGYWLRFVSNHVSHAFRLKVEALGVTVAEWVLLRELLHSDPACPSQLADRLGMTRGTISKLVDRVCQKGLATKTSLDDDRRFQAITLTTVGRRLVPRLARLADENDEALFGHLTPEQRSLWIAMLQDLARRHDWKTPPTS